MFPMAIGLIPFGVTIGATIASSSVDVFAGWLGGPLIAAGSAHLASLTLVDRGAPALAVLLAALAINARLAGYSAALAPSFRLQPTWFRLVGSYFLIDQTFALAMDQPDRESAAFRSFYVAAGSTLFSTWVAAITVGLATGAVIPVSWNLWMAAPLIFTGMAAQAVRDRSALVSALVAAVVAFLLADLPAGVGLLIAIGAGALAGAFARQGLA
jgi:predicted branched-subunit amino acid permease